MTAPAHRLILRAEVHNDGASFLTHTLDVTRSSLTLVSAPSASLAEGDAVRIRLSFPGLVREFEIDGNVVAITENDGYGIPATVRIDIGDADAEAREHIGRLIAVRSIPPPGSTPREAALRCLLVEDNPLICDMFSFALQKYCSDRGADVGMKVARTAEQGWSALHESPFDVAVIDHFLPAQTGAELIARIRGSGAFRMLAIVAISVGGADAREASIDAGADLFLDKPVAMRDLFTTLEGLTRRRRS